MDIELRHIHKRFGPVHANKDINLTFKGGRIVGILGENGAGKSTLMKILSGYQPASEGEIWLDGKFVDYRGPEAALDHGIGMLQQDPLDVPAFTVLENFVFGAIGARGIKGQAAKDLLNQVSKRFGFELEPETPTAHITIGQRQQLEIARLLALNVKVLILDEPTTGISAEQKEILFKALKQLAAQDGLSVLLVSHKLEDVHALCDEVAVLRAGELVGTKQLPATNAELITLMFGGEIAAPKRNPYDLSKSKPVLELDNLTLRGKRVTIQNLNLHMRQSEVIGLAGLDGSGQELLLRACVGLVKPHGGKIALNGNNMTHKGYRDYLASGVAFSAAGRLEEGLVAGLTLTEHFALVSEYEAVLNWERARKRTDEQIKRYNVRGRPDSRIEQLSGGNQQRVLMGLMEENPHLMALEYPTRGLDVDSAHWIWQQILTRRSGGTAIIFSSPDLDELVTYSDRILVFFAGKVTEIPDAGKTTIDEIGHLIGGTEAHS